MQLARLYLQLGIFLDYYTGDHSPSLSLKLRNSLQGSDKLDMDTLHSQIPAEHLLLFPQFNISATFPPTFLIHGELDSAVPVGESRMLCGLLKDAGVSVELRVIKGKEHSFDYEPGSEEAHADLFNEVFRFFTDCLQRGPI